MYLIIICDIFLLSANFYHCETVRFHHCISKPFPTPFHHLFSHSISFPCTPSSYSMPSCHLLTFSFIPSPSLPFPLIPLYLLPLPFLSPSFPFPPITTFFPLSLPLPFPPPFPPPPNRSASHLILVLQLHRRFLHRAVLPSICVPGCDAGWGAHKGLLPLLLLCRSTRRNILRMHIRILFCSRGV